MQKLLLMQIETLVEEKHKLISYNVIHERNILRRNITKSGWCACLDEYGYKWRHWRRVIWVVVSHWGSNKMEMGEISNTLLIIFIINLCFHSDHRVTISLEFTEERHRDDIICNNISVKFLVQAVTSIVLFIQSKNIV